MRVTVSFKSNLFPRRLEASAKALAAGRPEDWWQGAKERGLFSLFRLQRQLGSRWLSRSFTEQDIAASSFCRSAYPVLPSLPWHCDLDPASADELLSGRLSVFGLPWHWTADGRAGIRPRIRGGPGPGVSFPASRLTQETSAEMSAWCGNPRGCSTS